QQFLVAGLPRVALLLRDLADGESNLAADFSQLGQRRQYGTGRAVATIDLRKRDTGYHQHLIGDACRLARHHPQSDAWEDIAVVALRNLEDLSLVLHRREGASCGD